MSLVNRRWCPFGCGKSVYFKKFLFTKLKKKSIYICKKCKAEFCIKPEDSKRADIIKFVTTEEPKNEKRKHY